MTSVYDYLFLTLARGRTPHPALANHLKNTAGPALARSGGQVVAQFSPQLGWSNNEAAVLVRWPSAERRGDLGPVTATPIVAHVRVDRLTPTLRPADEDQPRSGGIYVHRWFEVDAGSAEEFVTLSGEGWKRFEAQFDTQIFGLFRVEADAADQAEGKARLLLMTRYADHGVWEASRDPTTEAMAIFARRQELTRRSWGCSTRLVPQP